MRDVPAKWRHLYKQAVARRQGRPMPWDHDSAWKKRIQEAKERNKAQRDNSSNAGGTLAGEVPHTVRKKR